METLLPSDRTVWNADKLAAAVSAGEAPHVVGVRGAGIALALAATRRAHGGPVVAVTPDVEAARALAADLRFLGRTSLVVDAGEQLPWADVVPDRRATQDRLAALYGLADEAPELVVVPAATLIRRVVPARLVAERSRQVAVLDEIDRDDLVAALVSDGYLRVPLVEDPGTVSVRGALLDVWPPGSAHPVRIELDGDLVASIKAFDPTDQRSLEEREKARLLPARESLASDTATARERIRDCCDRVNWPSSKTRALIDDLLEDRAFFGAAGFLPAFVTLEPLFEQLPDGAPVVVQEPSAVAEHIDDELTRAEAAVAEVADVPHFPLESFYVTPGSLEAWLEAHHAASLMAAPIIGGETRTLREAGRVDDDTPSLATYDQSELQRAIFAARNNRGHGAALDPLEERLAKWRSAGLGVVISARSTTQAERLRDMLAHRDIEVSTVEDGRQPRGDDPVQVVVGSLARGVIAPAEGLVLLTEEEIFGARAHRRKAKQTSRRKTRQLLEDLRSLSVGEHVVHTDHGIGRYRGLIHRQVGGHTVDLLVVEYAGGDKLYLPVYRLNQIHKFRGGEGAPKLDRLGGQTFARTKARTRKKVREMADQLLKLYAERQAVRSSSLPPVEDEYRAFEAAFPFEETQDQARAIEEVNADLEKEQPMDRLVCGDVGFGKTEVALRAAFRVAMNGRQVAMLCPTTVLAQQHAITFSERLGPYPVEIETLSRFRRKKDLDRAVRGLREGKVDVVIGTHRLLSKDVHFADLGLLVVDEEQRFGVAAKERIKALKTNVDVLTLSATPIPRTMQMAIGGLRDLSVMTTPPADRRAVRTLVTRRDPQVLREALERELSRGGQVFFVYNRVGGLEERAAFVQELAPRARIAIAHGRMKERQLERTMLDFVEGEYDVLCTTAIIENGLDIPRANTIIVDRADLMGLAQLYQLRGRVGRSRERGYCYLVLPDAGSVTDEAKQRLEALQRYTELGSGFQLASLDLDLRGAGDVLGAEQSGAIASVGIEMFSSMLEQAAAELRGEEVAADIDPELSFDVEALLPESYVPDVGVRLSLYKRLASALDEEDIASLAEEMEDRFGPPPPEAQRYLKLMGLKTHLRRLRVLACEATGASVTLHLRSDTPLDAEALASMLREGEAPIKLSPDMRLTRRSREGELLASGLEATDRLLQEIGGCVRESR